MATATITINLPEEKRGLFSRVPLRIGKSKLSPSSHAIAGKICSFSRVKKPDAVCRTSYDQLQQEFGVARATVAAALRVLQEDELISESRDSKGTAYKYLGEIGRKYDVVPQYLYTADFIVAGEKKRLTKAQVRVLSHIMTECKRPKNMGKYECSNAILARLLDLSETTIKKSIKILLKARLIYRPAGDKGCNGHKLTSYQVNKNLYIYEQFKKNVKRVEPTASKTISDIDKRDQRVRYYDLRRNEMARRVEKYRMQVYTAVPKFKELEEELRKIALPLVTAEHRKLNTYPILLAKKQDLEEKRRLLMQRYNIVEDRFKESYYATCHCCNDTGVLRDGKMCNCYLQKEKL